MKTERRKHFRARPQARVNLLWAGVDDPVECWLENVSGGGFFVKTAKPLPEDQPVSVAMSPRLGNPVFALAQVTRRQSEGDGFHYALAFVRIEPEDKLRLFQWLTQDILEE